MDLATLRSALEAREFFLVYQPIVSLRDRACFGGEALIRWRRADGVLEAAEFIAVSDRTPLSGAITYWVIDTIAEQLGDWLDRHPAAHISINVPPEVLGRGGLEYAADKSGLRSRAKQLILEITERGIPDQLGLDALNSVARTGARVALDDTTLSGANLALLTRCNFDFVKVDKALVAELLPDKPPAPWLDGLAALLRTTPLQIIAEGVENAFQAATLRAAGVQLAQGYYFSGPRSVSDFKRFYAENA
ncbi:MAG: EAL domain-containing protein [Gammaproteobacteria bacterium]|nr:EAL domain-containing protein [Gammaproteobacteria bacterium]